MRVSILSPTCSLAVETGEWFETKVCTYEEDGLSDIAVEGRVEGQIMDVMWIDCTPEQYERVRETLDTHLHNVPMPTIVSMLSVQGIDAVYRYITDNQF